MTIRAPQSNDADVRRAMRALLWPEADATELTAEKARQAKERRLDTRKYREAIHAFAERNG